VRLGAWLPFGALLAGCGTNRPEIPPELLASPDGVANDLGCNALGYPRGSYGTKAGNVEAGACFQGWFDPTTEPHTDAALESISLGNFFDPTGSKYELLLVNSAALWCTVCKAEHKTLPQHYTELAPHGLALVSALFQNNAAEPASVSDLKQWVETFGTNFPMVLDPDYQLGTYASAETAPLNLVIDARTMQIVETFVGDQGSVLWPLIEDELARREAE
jgi:hypothetical protein